MADLNTTFRPLALASMPTETVYQHPDGRVFLYFEVQPPIGGLIRGCSVWTPTGVKGEVVPRAALRTAAYADLVANCRRSRINHGSVE